MEKSRSLPIAIRGLFVSAFLSTIFGVANASAYTVTYNANGALFNTGEETNIVIYNDDHSVASGEYKLPEMGNPDTYELFWSTDEVGKRPIEIGTISSDATVYAQYSNVVWDYDYTGGEQTFTLPYSKYVRYELWGAEGGKTNDSLIGAYGGYSSGFARFNINTTIFINNGEAGGITPTYTYNGGGIPTPNTAQRYGGAGGGATHIATISGLLSELVDNKDKVLVVAGGAGGSTYNNESLRVGGSGGGFRGQNGLGLRFRGNGGTQTAGGANQSISPYDGRSAGFGIGGNAEIVASTPYVGGGGGAGWYGGSGGGFAGDAQSNGSGGGGSGYIASADIVDGVMYGYDVPTSDEPSTLTYSTDNYSDTATSKYAKQGNGYTRASIIRPTITYKWGDNEESMTVVYREKASINDIASSRTVRTGYNFVWQLNGVDYDFDTPVTEDITLVGRWTPIIYNLTYDLNGGELAQGASNPDTYTIESDDITLNNPTVPDYYDFLGWSGTNLTGDRNLTVTIPKGSIGNREYTANIAPTPYTITYNLDGGTNGTNNPTEYNYESGEIVLARPTKEGHTFLGWSGTGIDGENNLDVTIPVQSHGDREYTAHWSINQYTATFDVSGGTTIDPSTITSDYGVAFGTLPTTSRTGYNFLGWFTDATAGDEITDATKMPAGDVTYYAHWEIITYTIEYDLGGEDMDSAPTNDASNPTSYTVEDADITLKNVTPGDTWHYFVGWALDRDTEDGLTDNFVTDTSEVKNIKVYAIFQANPYTVTLDPGNGDDEIVKTVRGDKEISELPTPERTGYEFLGWFVGDKQIDEHFHPRSDSVAVARWAEILTVPDTGANSTPNTGDAIMDHRVTFAVCTFALFIIVALCKRKAKNEA